jgi:DNA replication initiation complex subunit (GINS family)
MSNRKTAEEELARLLEQKRKVRHEEVFGGFTQSERAAYDTLSNRIRDLENEVLEARQMASAAASQRGDWNKRSETDTPQSNARQPYRGRERDSSKTFTDSQKKSTNMKTDSDESLGA